MTITLGPVPPYCEGCANARNVGTQTDPEYLRCFAPEAPAVGPMRDGVQYISPELAEKARPYCSTMRVSGCGPDGAWFVARVPHV